VNAPGIHPDPPSDLHRRTPLLRTSPGPWIRFHGRERPPLHFSRVRTSRFSDPAGEFGVLYAADSFMGAFIETFGRDLGVRSVTVSSLAATGVAVLRADPNLRLLDLASRGGVARLSADARLMSGDLGVAQRWSRALWAHPIQADGLYYRLRHDPDQCACALFDRAARAISVDGQGPVSAAGHRESLIAALDCYKFGLIPE
jgi:hypothetical protein